MRKAIILSFIVAAMSSNADAQFYMRLGLGYAAPAAGQSIDGESTPYNGSSSGNQFTVKSASFTSGGMGQFGLGYMFSDHIGAQLDFTAGIAPRSYSYTIYNTLIPFTGAGNIACDETIENQAKFPLIATPSVVLSSGGDKVSLYSRLGLALPLNTRIQQDYIIKTRPGTGIQTVVDEQIDVISSFSLGYSAAVGINYKLNDRVAIWGEVSILSLSVFVKQENLTAYIQDGQSQPVSSVTNTPSNNYSKTGTIDTSGTINPTFSQPFSNVSFNVGIRFNLSESKRPHHGSAMKHETRDEY
jgi:hypothetical protein